MLHLAMRFMLEIVGLIAIGSTGYVAAGGGTAGVVAGVAAAVLFAVAWGRVAAPRAVNRLSLRSRQVAGSAMLLGVAAGLAWAGAPVAAALFGAGIVVNQLFLSSMDTDVAQYIAR